MLQETDLVIIGGGPAGLTAAIYAARMGLQTTVFEAETLGGVATTAKKIENYPGFLSVTGPELMEKMIAQAEKCGANLVIDSVTSIDCNEMLVTTTKGQCKTGAVIIATGSKPVAEWNVRGDIGSAKMLVDAGVNPLFAGLDITTYVKLNEENRMRLLYRNSPLTDALCGLYTLWRFEEYAYPNCTMFDGVAVGMVLWPELFTTKKVHVIVDDRGYTLIDETKEPNCEIGVTIAAEEFINRMMKRLLKQNFMRK